RLHPLLEYVLEHSHEQLDREEVAAVFGLSRRTLQNRLTDARLPPLRPFLTWCRLLVAAALLDEPGHTLDSVAAQLDFHDCANLGVALRRYTGTNITRLRDRGAFTAAIRAFRDVVDRSPYEDASLPQSSSAD
ncbi:helix-turn-helix domain-containing protein, partial [Gemmatimonas sp.]|uniref:helix-turn-helix domain-containing protein n=1 Tax=Gemmatimonas sp. TaxID=1962908 RepID=UPI003562397F